MMDRQTRRRAGFSHRRKRCRACSEKQSRKDGDHTKRSNVYTRNHPAPPSNANLRSVLIRTTANPMRPVKECPLSQWLELLHLGLDEGSDSPGLTSHQRASTGHAAAFGDEFVDSLPPFDSDPLLPETNVGRHHIAQALVVSPVTIVMREGSDLLFRVAGEEETFKQDAVFQLLVPALDLALG